MTFKKSFNVDHNNHISIDGRIGDNRDNDVTSNANLLISFESWLDAIGKEAIEPLRKYWLNMSPVITTVDIN